jgi:hypothetical protein
MKTTHRIFDATVTLLVAVLMLAVAGCGAPPLTQVYAARQTYTGSLDALTTAINTHQITDRATLLKIKDIRAKIEKGLNDAETAARNGDRIGFKFLMDQVDGWLEEYLTLQKPATRPTSLYTEPLWTPQRSSRSSWALKRPLPDWLQPTKQPTADSLSPMSRWQAFARNRQQLRLGTTLQ